MKGTIINRAGKHKHIFKRLLKPNEKIDLYSLYKETYAKEFSEEEFINHVKSKCSSSNGVSITDLDETPIEVPDEIYRENSAEEIVQKEIDKARNLTPSDIANLPYDPEETKKLLSYIDSSRTLAYALTIAKKKNKSKRLQKALAKRIEEVNLI